jgi:aspartate-semialdehyde dehydrogenase
MSDLSRASDRRHWALNRLADPALLKEAAYVGGSWIAANNGAEFLVSDPASGREVGHVADLGAAETNRAVDAACAALPDWQRLPPQIRSARLRAWHNLICEAADDLALILTLEQGKPLAEARGEIAYAASFVEWYAEEAKRLNIESVASHLAGAQMLVTRVALGPVALLTPWNFPSAMVTRKAAAALAAGCTIVLHPSPYTPLSALALAELGARAGLCAGVFNVVTGREPPIIAGELCKDARIRGVSFTGSTAVGRQVARDCAGTVKRMVMELGGNAPLIIFGDTDLEKALNIAMDAKFATSGQDCLAANRIFVQRPLYEAFCVEFAARVAALKVGHGLEEGAQIGPLMHERAVAATRARITETLALGARELTPRRMAPGPRFVMPSVFADVPDQAPLMRDEIFAPVAAIAPFDSEGEIIARANATEYGLVAYVVTRDVGRALRLNQALDYGMVAINRVKLTGAPIPFGGMKQSGLGREGSRQGIEAFTDIKYTCLELT